MISDHFPYQKRWQHVDAISFLLWLLLQKCMIFPRNIIIIAFKSIWSIKDPYITRKRCVPWPVSVPFIPWCRWEFLRVWPSWAWRVSFSFFLQVTVRNIFSFSTSDMVFPSSSSLSGIEMSLSSVYIFFFWHLNFCSAFHFLELGAGVQSLAGEFLCLAL